MKAPLRFVMMGLAVAALLNLSSCEHAKFRSDNPGNTMPWATPEGFENSGAGTPLGLMGSQGR